MTRSRVQVPTMAPDAKVAQLVEHVFRKDGVAGSIPAFGSMNILTWILIWYGVFAGYYFFFKKENVLYANSPNAMVSWYTIGIAISIAVFFDQLRNIVASTPIKEIGRAHV